MTLNIEDRILRLEIMLNVAQPTEEMVAETIAIRERESIGMLEARRKSISKWFDSKGMDRTVAIAMAYQAGYFAAEEDKKLGDNHNV